MHDTIDHWLTRFAAGAGSQYTWTIIELHEPGRIERLLRALLPGDKQMCPISAQATLETGRVYLVQETKQAGEQQGLSTREERGLITRAADDLEADPAIRARLLRICRVQ